MVGKQGMCGSGLGDGTGARGGMETGMGMGRKGKISSSFRGNIQSNLAYSI